MLIAWIYCRRSSYFGIRSPDSGAVTATEIKLVLEFGTGPSESITVARFRWLDSGQYNRIPINLLEFDQYGQNLKRMASTTRIWPVCRNPLQIFRFRPPSSEFRCTVPDWLEFGITGPDSNEIGPNLAITVGLRPSSPESNNSSWNSIKVVRILLAAMKSHHRWFFI